MKSIIISLLLLLPTVSFAQLPEASTDELTLKNAFDPLVNNTWVIEANWGDGSPFKQEIVMEFALNGSLVKSYTKGFVNPERTEFGERSFGVRQFDEQSGKILFWEYDVLGGSVEGEIRVEGKNLYFIYKYGGSTLADIWEYKDAKTFAFSLVSFENDQIGDTYLIGELKAKE